MMTAHRVALIDLVSAGQIDEVKELIKKGCDVNEKNYVGGCAVTMAVEHNDLDILEVLIEAKARVDVVDSLGRSALSRAKQLKHNEVAKLIEETLEQKKIADPNGQLDTKRLPAKETTVKPSLSGIFSNVDIVKQNRGSNSLNSSIASTSSDLSESKNSDSNDSPQNTAGW